MALHVRDVPLASGSWPHYSRYEIVGGSIVPSRGAKLIWSDPWRDFLVARRNSATGEVLYDELLRLLDGVRAKKPTTGEIARIARERATSRQTAGAILRPVFTSYEFNERALIAWVQRHGLLGLLHHRLEAVHIYDRGVGTASVSWSGNAWRMIHNEADAEVQKWLRATAREHGDVAETYAILRPVATPAAEVKLGAIAWRQYFPRLPDEKQERVPNMLADGTVWPHYGEPIDEFIGAAVSLRTMLVSLYEPKKRAFGAFDGLFFLEELLAPVRRTICVNVGGVLEPSWAAPSLIGTIGAMIFDDLTRQGRVAVCARCGRPRISMRAKYCGESCKKADEMARYRSRLKKKRTRRR